ncbi:MAG: FtsQ-type POTRA domain-containing protein [Acidobacteriota bacterium]
MRKQATVQKYGRLVVPTIIAVCLLGGIAFFGMMGYRTASASNFFAVRSVDVRGVDRAPGDDIKKIVLANTEKTGVWLADLPTLREKIEKLPFVKTAAVSMALPSGIRVNVLERVPAAIVRLSSGDFLVDADGVVLAPATKPEPSIPFVMRGWDEAKTEKAPAENLLRIKMYRKMLEEWRDFGIADRVKEVNLADTRDPQAVVVDSGRPINITLARDNLAKSLKSAIEAVAGKGEKVKAVNAESVSPVLEYLGN